MSEGYGVKPTVVLRYSEKYPQSRAGQPIQRVASTDTQYKSAVGGENPWAPFTSRLDWEVARWAKLRGQGSTAFSELLSIEGMSDALGLSYKNSDELNNIIDKKLPSRPQFTRHEVNQGGESLEFYSRDVMECIQSLWRDPDFVDDLILEPERQFADPDCSVRMYHDIHTGNWWWNTQKAVERDVKSDMCTILPVIISSDKTQVTDFRGKQAYPVYLTLGNIPKHIRRKPSRQGQILLAYLPTSKLPHITNKASRWRCLSNLFHHCMRFVLKSLERAGRDGVMLTSGDGAVRRCFPILAAYPADYPEQLLVTLVKSGQCPVCPAPRNEIGELTSKRAPRSTPAVIAALDKVKDGAEEFQNACREVGVKPVQSVFWKSLPHVDIYRAITPDILHQLYQGVFKHTVAWIKALVGEAEIDARCRRLPPNHHIRLFMKGISNLSRVTGTEHDQISRFLLALVADIRLPNGASNVRLVKCVRALLDFIYLARFPIHTTDTLNQLDQALDSFHKNKAIFIDLGVRENFNIPKVHFMCHYRDFIEYLGAPDNFNTEYSERLHIDFTKQAYEASNCKDEYPQMTRWVHRKEQMQQHEKFIRRRLDITSNSPLHVVKPLPSLIPQRRLRMTIKPTRNLVPITEIVNNYGALGFEHALRKYVAGYRHPGSTNAQLEADVRSIHLPFQKVPVYHRIKFVSFDMHALNPLDESTVDSIHVEPEHPDKYGNPIPGRFDVVLVRIKSEPESVDLQDTAADFGIAQVRCVFGLPERGRNILLGQDFPFRHLAYVEWFTPLRRATVDPNTQLYRVRRLTNNKGERNASVIPVELIKSSVHLYAKFGPQAPVAWTSSNVLDEAEVFYVSVFSDRFMYATL
ncbi:hypothetical protein BJ165DRAFT_1353838 [Panaeolus papilionaceus]|nr:hypothetical protein BJ165DRAFT_1353838 [Panaeolus papilionaceus]